MATLAVSEYQKAAEDFLKRHSITFSQEFVGKDCPIFCGDAIKRIDMDKTATFPRKTHIHGYHYRCTFTKPTPPGDLANRMDPAYHGPVSVRPLIIDFWNSYADEEYNCLFDNRFRSAAPASLFLKHGFKESGMGWLPARVRHNEMPIWRNKGREVPTPYGVLTCIEKSDPGTFEDFCGNFGFDTDSRRAETTYRAVQDQWRDTQRFFTAEELVELQEIG